jgi:hypothetical protein
MVPTVPSALLGAVRLAPGVTVEGMGAEFLALVGHRVVRVSGPAAVVLAALQDRAVGAGAGPASVGGVGADEVPVAVDVLVGLGVLERTGVHGVESGPAPVEVSRRRALGVAATAAALGVTVLVLPQAAAAASGTDDGSAAPAGGGGNETPQAPDAPTNVLFSAEEDALTVSWTA